MFVKKAERSPSGFWILGCAFHPARNSTFRDLEPQHEKLAMERLVFLARAGHIVLPPVSYVRHNPLGQRARPAPAEVDTTPIIERLRDLQPLEFQIPGPAERKWLRQKYPKYWDDMEAVWEQVSELARVLVHEGRKYIFCSEPCQWICLREPTRLNGTEN